eukprot:CAMPEP_0179474832 /NCGR_PEP_ID=MMETSP0799-20121207/54184_1 /TAXON_ID=46947 /ORGANISM="Geminigera cryophila, Strain CCMP2564" /LENGTH=105 /DNA_ID=CAMNT_0021284081 /DNA_START=218 /DNA_END=531 /DNA_ORIENTATION=-
MPCATNSTAPIFVAGNCNKLLHTATHCHHHQQQMIMMMGCAGIVTVTARGIEDDECLFLCIVAPYQLVSIPFWHPVKSAAFISTVTPYQVVRIPFGRPIKSQDAV